MNDYHAHVSEEEIMHDFDHHAAEAAGFISYTVVLFVLGLLLGTIFSDHACR